MNCSAKCCNALGHRDELVERAAVVAAIKAELAKQDSPALRRLLAMFTATV